MKVEIISTGSDCNCVIATFTDNKKIMFDFGTGALKKCITAGVSFDEIENLFISHNHSDHCGDVHHIEDLFKNKSTSLIVKKIPLVHNVENNGFAVLNPETLEAFYYFVDFNGFFVDNTFNEDYFLNLFKEKSIKHFAMIELSYVDYLFTKMDPEMKIGLSNHFSDNKFKSLVKKIYKINDEVNVVSLHASKRPTLEVKVVGTVCPEVYVKKMLFDIFGKKVRFGKNGQTYFYLED